jgi:hypothetical protein
MSTRRWVLLGGAVVVVLVAVLLVARPGGSSAPSAPPTGSGGLLPAATVTAGPSATPVATPSPSPSAAPTSPPSPSRVPTAPPRATGDPRLAYAAFLLRINDDRSQVERLNQDLSTAAQAQDARAVRTASVAILGFVDGERDWLREHPPADCYAAAHGSANAMLDAYGTAADRFIHWADSGGGLAGLAALGDAVDAAQTASDALTTFGRTLEGTTCAA